MHVSPGLVLGDGGGRGLLKLCVPFLGFLLGDSIAEKLSDP